MIGTPRQDSNPEWLNHPITSPTRCPVRHRAIAPTQLMFIDFCRLRCAVATTVTGLSFRGTAHSVPPFGVGNKYYQMVMIAKGIRQPFV